MFPLILAKHLFQFCRGVGVGFDPWQSLVRKVGQKLVGSGACVRYVIHQWGGATIEPLQTI